MNDETFDVAIVGGGPAGLSAGIWLARYLHRVVLVDSGDPRNWETRSINGFLGSAGVRPAELRGRGRDTARDEGVTLLDGVCDRVAKHTDDHFELTLNDGQAIHARRLLLAIGLRDVWPEIEGVENIYGTDAHICPDCDGREAAGKKVGVIGSGRRAVGLALNLTTWTQEIIICTNGAPPDLDKAEYCQKLDALNIPVLDCPIVRIKHSGSRVHALEFSDGMELDVDKVFFALGQYPADDLGSQLKCERDVDGHIIVDATYHSSVTHCFAAGDIVPGPQLAIAAASDGAIAALAMHKTLVPEARTLRALPAR